MDGPKLLTFRRKLGLSRRAFGEQFGGFSARQIETYEKKQAQIPFKLLWELKRYGFKDLDINEIRESPGEYAYAKLNRDLLRPFLPMVMLMWLIRELPRLDSKLQRDLLHGICESCAFDDQMVWEMPK